MACPMNRCRMATIAKVSHHRNAVRDYASSGFLSPVAEFRDCVIRWRDSEAFRWRLPSRKRIQSKDCSSVQQSSSFFTLGRGEADSHVFPSPRRGTSHSQAIEICRWGRAAGFHVHPHQPRHSHATHAVQRGSMFTLQCSDIRRAHNWSRVAAHHWIVFSCWG